MAPKHEQTSFLLPTSIVSPTDIARLLREIESIDNFFRESAIRSGGQAVDMPRISGLMDSLVSNNQLNLLQEQDRQAIAQVLQSLNVSAPVLHISFSVDPPGAYVQKIVGWIREHIHGYALVTVGLQPNIGAGCVVRTTNRLFDFSLKQYFADKRSFFITKLHEAISNPTAQEYIAPPAPTPTVVDLPVATQDKATNQTPLQTPAQPPAPQEQTFQEQQAQTNAPEQRAATPIEVQEASPEEAV